MPSESLNAFSRPRNPVLTSTSCEVCGKQKRCIRVEPDMRYINLDAVTFACDCGEEGPYYVAHTL